MAAFFSGGHSMVPQFRGWWPQVPRELILRVNLGSKPVVG
jgi:hypothetical protein